MQLILLDGDSEVELLFNELSFHGQFEDASSFAAAVAGLMTLRQVAKRFGREIRCCRELAQAQVTQSLKMPQLVNSLRAQERTAFLQWLTRHGPFWEDSRDHSSDEYLDLDGTIVTDTAVGEAAFGILIGRDLRLVSLTPSKFNFSPLIVSWKPSDDEAQAKAVQVPNHWIAEKLESALQSTSPAVESWAQLEAVCRERFDRLTMSHDCFVPLRGSPFVEGASNQLLALLAVLNKFCGCFDDTGQRSAEGHRIYQDHFTGPKAWFSDSSDSEKIDFKHELTFCHPNQPDGELFCTWHGKVKWPQIRAHFSWPVQFNKPVYLVYVGPKRTKR